MKRPQTSINTGLAATFTLFYLQKSSYNTSNLYKSQSQFLFFLGSLLKKQETAKY